MFGLALRLSRGIVIDDTVFHSEIECQSFQGSCPLDEEPSVADNTEDNTDVSEDEDSEQRHTDMRARVYTDDVVVHSEESAFLFLIMETFISLLIVF